MKNTIKMLTVVFLMCLSVYQAGELWFENFSGHNFFWFGNSSPAVSTRGVDCITERLIVNLGDGKVVCRLNDMSSKKYKKYFDNAIGTALAVGELSDTQGVDWSEILKKRAVIYEYSCVLKGSDSGGIFEAAARADTLSKLTDYNTVIIIPTSDSSSMEVIFYNSENGLTSEVQLKNNDVIAKCYEGSELLGREEQRFTYISTVLNGFTIFSGNIFIPTWSEENEKYNQIEPYYYIEETNGVEKNADLFFDNPVNKTASRSKGVETFGDESTVVKYYPTGVFEYSNYKVSSEKTNSFVNNYNSALSVLKKDAYVDNELYLDSYSADANGNYTFKFNYKIDDLKLKPADGLKAEIGMDSFIEITTSKGRVSKYRKYAVSYRRSNSIATASSDYISAIDKLYAKLYGSSQPKAVSDVELCYQANIKTVDLDWIIKIDSEEYISNAR